jgi:CRISPR-associated protein Cas8c/Csp2
MIAIHPYIRYAQALIMNENDLNSCEEITSEQIISEIEKGLNSFRLQPVQAIEGKDKVKFDFARIEKGDPKQGLFLAPNVITTDMQAKNTWKAASDLVIELQGNLMNAKDDMTMSIIPMTGEYLNFSIKGSIGRGKPKCSLSERGFGLVTTLTKNKPSLISTDNWVNTCLIPDLSIDKMVDFISFFKRMLVSQTVSDLLTGNVETITKGKGQNASIIYKPKRPLIFKGNFPNPPRSSALSRISLLGTIGEFAKNAEFSDQSKRVLESLKNTEIYLIEYGGAKVFTYNHHVIDLAKEGKLKAIVDGLYFSLLFRGKRFGSTDKNFDSKTEYQKFDLFTSRFLQLFNHAAFKDFLAFRAEYPNPITILFNTYFIKMEKIDPKIVSSARELGKWLNKVAYFTAKAEVKAGTSNYWEELRRVKSKALIELESSTFSAKSGDALIAQAVTRAGRLSGLDAPEAAALFMEKTASGELPLENAKNLLIAFSRLINKAEKKEVPIEYSNDDSDEIESDHSEE